MISMSFGRNFVPRCSPGGAVFVKTRSSDIIGGFQAFRKPDVIENLYRDVE